ncbi:sensor histidine kinase [Leptospira wolffii]|uniref:Sensor histidine kinase n=1 Tax=Leptospira wolffii TaxID=409998 RepID=A0ABV5BPS8_9LEPT|nr:ATP-binding protein [Leptospira wolffii]TGL47535.1 sensor histidine kinase [Leptospira wolffii]
MVETESITEERVRLLDVSSIENASRYSEAYPKDCDIIKASSVEEALEKSFSYSPKIIVFRYRSEEIDIMRFLSIIHKLCANSVFLVFLSEDSSQDFDRLRDWIWGVYPESEIQFILKKEIPKVLEFLRSDSGQKISDIDSESFISELEWLVWKETRKSAEGNYLGRNIIDNLYQTLSQGLGIGSLISRLELAEIFMKKEDQFARIPKQLMSSILENKEHLRERNENLDRFKKLFELKIAKQATAIGEIDSLVQMLVEELGPVAAFKKQTIQHHGFTKDEKELVFAQPDFSLFAIRELFVNALKFSPEGSVICSSFITGRNYIIFRVLNDISVIEGGVTGIPEEFKFRLFEPFFKLNNVFDERFYNLEFGMGMGLNLIQSMARQSESKVTVEEILDDSRFPPERRVAADLRFRICSNESESRISSPV